MAPDNLTGDIMGRNVGIDIGYGFSKVITDKVEFVFPSVVYSFDGRITEIEGLSRPDIEQERIVIDGTQLLVGQSAINYGQRLYSAREKDWLGSIAYRSLLIYALSSGIGRPLEAGTSGPADNLNIVTGLPVNYYGDKDKLTAVIRNIIGESGVDIKIVPQPLGSFFDCLMNDDAIIKDHELAEESVGIIDIGFFTSDFVIIQELEFIKKKLDSHEGGISSAYEQIARHIYDSYGIKKEVYELDRVVNDGFIKVFGEKKDVRPAISRCLKELASEVEVKARTLWGDGVDIDRVIVTGGGAVALKDYLNLYKHARVIPGPQIANARGYMKFFRMLYNAG